MKELITVQPTPAILKADFKAAKKLLTEELDKYRIVVTGDTVKDAKLLATELNGMASDINKRNKDAVDIVSEPIREFSSNMKELATMCKDGRQAILDQVKAFENVTREKIQHKLEDLRLKLWNDIHVDAEFKSAEFDDLILLSNMTAKGSLTGKAKDVLTKRVMADKAKQIEVEMRLLKLENRCFKAGLKVPLERMHVNDFLFFDESVYETRLSAMIHVEVERQKKSEAMVREQVEQEAEIKEHKEKYTLTPPQNGGKVKEDDPAPVPIETTPVKKEYVATTQELPQADLESIKSGNVVFNITAVFQVSVPATVNGERIKAKLQAKFAAAGFTSLQSLQVEKS